MFKPSILRQRPFQVLRCTPRRQLILRCLLSRACFRISESNLNAFNRKNKSWKVGRTLTLRLCCVEKLFRCWTESMLKFVFRRFVLLETRPERLCNTNAECTVEHHIQYNDIAKRANRSVKVEFDNIRWNSTLIYRIATIDLKTRFAGRQSERSKIKIVQRFSSNDEFDSFFVKHWEKKRLKIFLRQNNEPEDK